jgi:hypothetical protein
MQEVIQELLKYHYERVGTVGNIKFCVNPLTANGKKYLRKNIDLS